MMAQSKSIESFLMNIQKQIKGAIADYQMLQSRLSADRENVEVLKELNAMKQHIVSLGTSQRPYIKLLRMKNAIRTKSNSLVEPIPEKMMRLTDDAELDTKSKITSQVVKVVADELKHDAELCQKMWVKFEEEKENIAQSIDRNIGITLEPQKMDEKEIFMACIELVTLERARQVCDAVQKYKAEYALEHPLLEIPRADPSKRRRTETYLSCVQKKRKVKQREPSSDRETGESQNLEDASPDNGNIVDLPDQPFNEHQFSQESVCSNPDDDDARSQS